MVELDGGAWQRKVVAAAVAACSLLLTAPGWPSGQPTLASYSADRHRSFWFVHITDLHVGAGDESRHALSLLVNSGQQMFDPWFYVASGDLVEDGRLGEWQDYQDIIVSAGLGTDRWIDIPGNHDNNLDGDDFDPGFLDYWYDYSVTGASFGTVHRDFLLETDFGRYQLVGVYTDGEADRRILPDELAFAEAALAGSPDARLAFVTGHHPLRGQEAADPTDCAALEQLLDTHAASLYLFGHTHATAEPVWPHEYLTAGYLSWLSATLGKPEPVVSPAGFSLFAVDNDSLVGRLLELDQPWFGDATLPTPVVLVTAPADWAFGGANPYAYPVSQSAASNPVRALVFSIQPVTEVRFRYGSLGWQPMQYVAGFLWEGSLPGSAVGQGGVLEVQATAGSHTDSHLITIRSVPLAVCEDGIDNDGDGATDFPVDPGCSGSFDSDEREPFGVGPYVPGSGGSAAGGGGAEGGAGIGGNGLGGTLASGGSGAAAAGSGQGASALVPPPGSGNGEDAGCGCRLARREPGSSRHRASFGVVLSLLGFSQWRRPRPPGRRASGGG